MRHLSHIVMFTLLTALLLASHVDAVEPLHNLTWCKANMVCNDPDYPVMGMYTEVNSGYTCLCSAFEGNCSSFDGSSMCQFAVANVNCAWSFWTETQANTAGYQYGMCTRCKTGYQLSDDPNPSFDCWACNATIPNCEHCSTDGVCDSCAAGYSLSDLETTCFSCHISNCNTCTADDVCGSCADGYKLKGTSTCKKNGVGWWVWLIVGIVAAAVVAGIIVLVVCCVRRRRSKAEESSSSTRVTSKTEPYELRLGGDAPAPNTSAPSGAFQWSSEDCDVARATQGSQVAVADAVDTDSH